MWTSFAIFYQPLCWIRGPTTHPMTPVSYHKTRSPSNKYACHAGTSSTMTCCSAKCCGRNIAGGQTNDRGWESISSGARTATPYTMACCPHARDMGRRHVSTRRSNGRSRRPHASTCMQEGGIRGMRAVGLLSAAAPDASAMHLGLHRNRPCPRHTISVGDLRSVADARDVLVDDGLGVGRCREHHRLPDADWHQHIHKQTNHKSCDNTRCHVPHCVLSWPAINPLPASRSRPHSPRAPLGPAS
jgi:hypothetical protein